MGSPSKSRGFVAATVTAASLALLVPANAQFFDWGGRGDWGGRQQQRQQPSRDGWGGGGGGFWTPFESRPQRDRGDRGDRELSIDYSKAPAPTQKKPEATTNVVVMGDAMADWLALGLEEAFSENPEIGIVRKHRTESGLIRYEGRRDVEWAQIAKEIIAAEKPKFIVMMVGNNDRQAIREKAPVVARPGVAAATKPQSAQPAQPSPAAPPAAAAPDPEQQIPEGTPEPAPPPTPEQVRQGALGPFEFHTEKWEVGYIRRIDATIAALKTAGVPVIWVGLPSQRGAKASSDSSYLNELFRSRAEKAGITYVDVWDGFVDEAGRFTPQGPDYEGQTRRLRSGDGIYFTKFGARKLAHYVEREIQRHITNRAVPVALPIPVEPGAQPGAKPGGPAQRPAVGPVVPLTAAATTVPEELIGGGRATRAAPSDPVATRVLTKGEPIPAPTGRADDFSWPRGSAPPPAEPVVLQPTPPSPAAPVTATAPAPAGPTTQSKAGQRTTTDGQAPETKPAPQRRTRSQDAPRPPLAIQGLQGLFR
jgi:hypothetical protein